ncbi:seipin-3 isoform X3 [Cryptomeria japonica]|uniref:seipin-3 isoform X3 n=1 Tax=Cryptomeria japonica TaxID=3369 RepID=UPI0027DA884A|nr:seipin-3 isoform X3 [Cryptomeria japonica]
MAEKNPEGYVDSEEILCEKSSVEDEAESCLEKQPTEPRFHSINSLRRRRKMNVSRLSRENNGFLLGNDSTNSQISSNCVGLVKDENREVIDVEPVAVGEDEEEKELPTWDGDKDICRDETITVADSMPEPSSGGRGSSSFVFWLADIVIQAVGFQAWFMLRVLSLPSYLMHQGYHLPSTLLSVKENMSSLIDTVLQVPSHLQPSVGRRIERIGWGCILSWYVFWLLLLLMLAAFVLSFFVMHTLVEKPVHMKEALYFDYTKPHPVAFVSLQSCSATSNLEDNHSSIKDRYQKNVLPPRLIPANHRLEVAVELTLPESDHNIKLGIFQFAGYYDSHSYGAAWSDSKSWK